MDAGETTIFYAFLIGAVTIGMILGYFLVSLVRLRRRYLDLHRSGNKSRLQLLEQERTRIAADLHDELGPILSAAKFKITEVEPPVEEDRQLLQQAAGHLNDIISRIRQISNNLMPNTLLRKGPEKAIAEYIQMLRSAGLPFAVRFVSGNIPRLPEENAIHIYRILQEIIHNTLKHAKATELRIRLCTKSDRLIMICTDNGVGFNAGQVAAGTRGLGLQNLLLRSEMLGGAMFLDTKPGKGTRIMFELPLQKLMNTKNELLEADQYHHGR